MGANVECVFFFLSFSLPSQHTRRLPLGSGLRSNCLDRAARNALIVLDLILEQVKTSVVAQANGSARVRLGSTDVLAGVKAQIRSVGGVYRAP